MKEVKELYEGSSLTLEEIANTLGLKCNKVWRIIEANYSKEVRDARKKENYRKSKLGDKNPSKGLVGEDAFNFKGNVPVHDGKGYLIIPKPEWYTGRKGSKYVFQHAVVMCQALGITEIPAGFSVHHIDRNKINNNINNLALLSNGAHTRLHALERATTIRKE